MSLTIGYCKKPAAAVLFLISVTLIAESCIFANELAQPTSLAKNHFAIILAEMLQIEPCFFSESVNDGSSESKR